MSAIGSIVCCGRVEPKMRLNRCDPRFSRTSCVSSMPAFSARMISVSSEACFKSPENIYNYSRGNEEVSLLILAILFFAMFKYISL